MGKYGFIDANGKQRVIEYGANKFGFQPSGEGITVSFVWLNFIVNINFSLLLVKLKKALHKLF